MSTDPSKDFKPEFRKDLLGGIVVLRHRGYTAPKKFDEIPLYSNIENQVKGPGKPAELTLIPYYTFLNRGPAAMQVWNAYER